MDILGYIAATLTTVAFIPQVILVYRTKNTESISLLMFLIFCSGLVAWAIYGIMINSWPIIAANVFTMLLAGYILAMKLLESKRNRR
jgi:MtN3 and saliva related transmembrane protein